MKRNLVILFIVIISTSLLIQAVPGQKMQDLKKSSPAAASSQWKVDLNYGKIPLYFIPNKGQVHKKAIFYAQTSRYILWMTKEGLVFDSIKRERVKGEKEFSKRPGKFRDRKNEKIYRDVSRILFLNANKNPEIVPLNKTEHVVSYFKGKDPSKWKTGINTSKAVLYKSLYKNIDLKIYGVEKQIEYDWIVKPGGNPAHIRFEYKNVKRTRIDEKGNLLIETQFGELVHKKPISYQEINGNRIHVEVTFKKTKKNSYSFKVGTYNRKHELIIDPVVLAFSTYLGGTAFYNMANDVALDDGGAAYVVGFTNSTDFPIINPWITTDNSGEYNHGQKDITITKFSSSGDSLIYSSYFGYGETAYPFTWVGDIGNGIAVDSNGKAYVIGTYIGPFAGDREVIVIKLSGSGTSLEFNYRFGGSADDSGYAIALGNNEVIYITGSTDSDDFPLRNEFQDYRDERISGFVMKMDTKVSENNSIIYSTYLGI